MSPFPHAATPDSSFDQLARLFAGHGLTVTPTPKARARAHMVSTLHDEVPYALSMGDAYGLADPNKLTHNLTHFKLTTARHHTLVKAVYQHLQAQGLADVWCMLGGGSQLQVFFSAPAGYLACLYLTLEDLDEQERLTQSGYLDACGNSSFTLAVQWRHNNRFFKAFKHPEIEVRLSTL